MDVLDILVIDDPPINFNVVGEIVNNLVQPLEIVDNNNERRNIPRNEDFYEVTIPLYVGDIFREHFRMSRAAFEELTRVVGNLLHEIRHIIPVDKKLLFTIWVISKPESFLAAGDRFGMSRSTTHTVFKQIITAINTLLRQFIRWPRDYNVYEETFHNRYRIPGIVRAIDGCHIEIKQPIENANDYYNRNNYHSIILQGICDPWTKFIDIYIYIYIGVPGRVHDARVFRNSPIFERIHSMPINLHILADSAYLLSTNVMTPFRDNGHLNNIQRNYNRCHSAARAVIERAFGRLKDKFRRLKYLDISKPDFGSEIISVACILHNFVIIQDGEGDEDFQPDVWIGNDVEDDAQPHGNRNLAIEKRIQIAEQLL